MTLSFTTKQPWEVERPDLKADYPDVPDPEVVCTDVDPEDARVPRAVRTLIKSATQARITYARGPKTHSIYGHSLGIVDSVKLTCRSDCAEIVATWEDGKFYTGYILKRDHDSMTVTATSAKSRELKAALIG